MFEFLLKFVGVIAAVIAMIGVFFFIQAIWEERNYLIDKIKNYFKKDNNDVL